MKSKYKIGDVFKYTGNDSYFGLIGVIIKIYIEKNNSNFYYNLGKDYFVYHLYWLNPNYDKVLVKAELSFECLEKID